MVPLIGMMLGSVLSAIAAFIAYRNNTLQSLVSWSTGDFSMILNGRYEVLWIAFIVCLFAYVIADKFTLAGLGQEFSNNLGLNYRQVLFTGLIIVSVTTATVVSTVGALPFIGLIIPNIVSIIAGDNIRKTAPYTAILGASFVLICDIISRTVVYPFEIPIGSVISVLGGGIFLMMIIRGAKKSV